MGNVAARLPSPSGLGFPAATSTPNSSPVKKNAKENNNEMAEKHDDTASTKESWFAAMFNYC